MLRENAYKIVKEFIIQKYEFRLIIWNLDDWEESLPDHIMEEFETHLVLDIKGDTLLNSEINEDGLVVIKASFEDGLENEKVLFPEDIVAILESDGRTIHVNNFGPEDELSKAITSRSEVIASMVHMGLDAKSSKKS